MSKLIGSNRSGHGVTRIFAVGLGGTMLAFSLAACGSQDTPSAASAVTESAGVPAAGECGAVPSKAPTDPDGVIASMPKDVQANYNLYATPVLASAWADWKPSHAGPYKVAILWQPPLNDFVSKTHEALVTTLKDSGDVKIIADVAPQGPTDVPGSLQQFGQLVAMKPDLIIAFPLAAEPFVEPINQAGKAGIPVVVPWSPVPSKYAVSVAANQVLGSASLAAQTLRAMDGKGSVLEVHGIPGLGADNDIFTGFKAALGNCPKVKVAGEITGNFVSAGAKAAALQFLSTHPAGVNGVLQAGAMTTGIVQAHEQLGKPVPPIADIGSTEGSLSYFSSHKDALVASQSVTYQGIGSSTGRVALRILAGDGPKSNQIVTLQKSITRENLSDIVKPGWNEASAKGASVPGDQLFSDSDLDDFFGVK